MRALARPWWTLNPSLVLQVSYEMEKSFNFLIDHFVVRDSHKNPLFEKLINL